MANYIYNITYNNTFIRNIKVDSSNRSNANKRVELFLKSLYPVKYKYLVATFYAIELRRKKGLMF
jgi:hypothetical protein